MSKEKYSDEDKGWYAVTYKDMVCRNCKFVNKKINKVTICKAYPLGKPNEVIKGGNCERFSKL